MQKTYSDPLVSIVLPVFNGEKFMRESIESVLRQDYKNIELIIIDDGSQDSSLHVAGEYKEKDSRVKLIRNNNNLGVAMSLNRAISFSRGKYIARMDADDIMEPKRISKQVHFFKKNPGVVVLGSWVKEIDKNGKTLGVRKLPTSHKDIREMMYYAMGLQHPTIMFNMSLIPKDFSWYSDVKYTEDLEMLFRLIKYGEFANLNEVLLRYRVHADNLSLKDYKQTFLNGLKVRKDAARNGYKPTFKSKVLNYTSQIVVRFFPRKVTMELYKLLRK